MYAVLYSGRGNFEFLCTVGPSCLSLSGIVCREDIDRLFRGISEMRIVETGVWEVERNVALSLKKSSI